MSLVGHFRKTCRVGLPEASVQGATIRESCSSSLVRAAHRLLALIALPSSILVCWMAWPAHAVAATWPLSASACSVDLGFQQTYTAGAKSYVHSGIDASASAGLQIVSPLAGTVRFTGTVPSGDSRLGQAGQSGKTMRAVSIQIADGRTVTLMPFDTISVKKGQQVAEGEALGTLAASGDVLCADIVLSEGSNRALADGIGGNCGYEISLMAVVGQRHIHVGLAAAVVDIELVCLDKLLIVGGG